MQLMTSKPMFDLAYTGGFAIGAFNVNNMEITQSIIDACAIEKAPVILQFSKGARKYAKEFGDGESAWSKMFNKPTRELVAHEFATTFYEENK